MSDLRPSYSVNGDISTLSCALSHRTFSSIVYPVQAPNGSTVVVYGHESGIRAVWLGGHAPSSSPPAPNGGKSGPAAVPDELAELPEPELDPFEPYPHVVHSCDVNLASEALRLASPPLLFSSAAAATAAAARKQQKQVPGVLADRIVVAVACSDMAVRLVVLPIAPWAESGSVLAAAETAAAASAQQQQQTTVVKLASLAGGHQDLISDLTLTWTSTRGQDGADQEGDFDLLVASASADGGGLLCLYAVPVSLLSDGLGSGSPQIPPFQQVRLTSIPTGLQFNPSTFPSRRHTLLLVAEQNGAVRIYDPLQSDREPPSQSSVQAKGLPSVGTWMASFLSQYTNVSTASSSAPSLATPIRILDAKWVLDGSGILALFEDSTWGVWDLRFSSDDRLVTSGGQFLRSGRLDVSIVTANKRTVARPGSSSGAAGNEGRLEREHKPIESTTQEATGGISVARSQSADGVSTDEAVVVWYRGHVFAVPDLASYFALAHKSTAHGGQPIYDLGNHRIEGVGFAGEYVTSICPIANVGRVGAGRRLNPTEWDLDIVVGGERQFVLWSNHGFGLRETNEPFFQLEEYDEDEEDGFVGAEMLDDEAQETVLRDDEDALPRVEYLDIGGLERQMAEVERLYRNERSR